MAVGLIERGESMPRLDTLVAISQALEIGPVGLRQRHVNEKRGHPKLETNYR